MTPREVAALLLRAEQLEQENKLLRKYHFGQSSERRALEVCEPADQLHLELDMLTLPKKPPSKKTSVKAFERECRPNPTPVDDESAGGLKFDDKTMVIEVIAEDPAIAGVDESDLVVLNESRHNTIVQLPPYAVVTTICRTTKNKLTGKISCPKVPDKVFDRCYADVSLLAGLMVDKYAHHLPAYRQHQRLGACGIKLGRKTLTAYIHRSAEVLEPIWTAQHGSVMSSEVLSADETPTPAGHGDGKIKNGFFWAFQGDRNELSFLFSPSRSHKVLDAALGSFQGVLLSDGYAAYERFAAKTGGVLWAGCWAHVRRKFIEAEGHQPQQVARIISLFQRLYEVEKTARGKPKHALKLRQQESRPLVDELFSLFAEDYKSGNLLPTSPYVRALSYALQREAALRVFLENPELPIDNNHVERAIRPTAIGRKNWMFHFTEAGARKAAIIYSLIWTCRLQDIDPTTYLIDVLQRIQTHPALEVDLLTPRLWKEHFAGNPMRSIASSLTLAPR